jgi:agarase
MLRLGLAVALALPVGLCRGEELPLPEGERIVSPWEMRVFLEEGSGVSEAEAAALALADEPDVGRCLVVGPWLAGMWSARVQYTKRFPPEPIGIRGLYRTQDLLPMTAGGRAEFFDANGRRRGVMPFSLPASDHWRPFSVRLDKFPPGTDYLQVAFGLLDHTVGRAHFARLETLPAGKHPLAEMAESALTRPAPPGPQKGTGFYRVEQHDGVWWLIEPDGNPWYSLAVDLPTPPSDEQFLPTARRYVAQVRGWGFNSIAGWSSTRTWMRYDEAAREGHQAVVPVFRVINFHDPGPYGQFDVLTDRRGQRRTGEHGFPDPFDPRFEETAYAKAEAIVAPFADRPELVAWFADNEMAFAELHRYLWSEHCSRALVAHLRGTYPSIELLNERWGTEFADWEALRAAKPEPPLERGPMYEDLVSFEPVLVKRFIDISIAAIRRYDPKHLIASNRYNMGGLGVWMRTIDLCSAYDIVACNLYPDNQEPGVGEAGLQVLREVARRTGRPMIIGEWSVPAMDSGLYEGKKHTLDWSFPQAVPTQAIRATQAAAIVTDYYNEPYMVGAHWFIYSDFDSPDREANRGLVRSDGTPYEELTSALTKVHGRVTESLQIPR